MQTQQQQHSHSQIIFIPDHEPHSLESYVNSQSMSAHQRSTILHAISQKKKLLISGKTGAGKSQLFHAMIEVILGNTPQPKPVVLIEQFKEAPFDAPHLLRFTAHGSKNPIEMADLMQLVLEHDHPSWLLLDEIRDEGTAMILGKAWRGDRKFATGTIATVTANSASSALAILNSYWESNSHAGTVQDFIEMVIHIERDSFGLHIRVPHELRNGCGKSRP